MSSASIENLLRRDRRIIAGAIAVLTALAWSYLIWMARDMSITRASMPEMPGMDMSVAMAPMLRIWTASDFTFIFLMWAIMMIGMMTPSATPMILIYARVARQAAKDGKPLASTGWFAVGYLLSWTGFSVLAAVAQGLLQRAAMLTPMMAAATPGIGGVVLIAAGLYQGTPLKEACLTRCRAPFDFIQTHGFRKGIVHSIRMGLDHGVYCIGCCWMLMLLLFAGGVMNIAWIAVISIFVLIEKVFPEGRVIARFTGVALVLAGLCLLLRG